MAVGHVDRKIGVVDHQKENAGQKIHDVSQHQIIDGGSEWSKE